MSRTDLTDALRATRGALVAFAEGCTDDQWTARPLGDDDPRTVGVIVDHVADAYEYIGSWITELAAGGAAEVNAEVVDGLNARHAAAGDPSRAQACAHLTASGDDLIALIESVPDELVAPEARITRLAEIAARHADAHRDELQRALGSPA